MDKNEPTERIYRSKKSMMWNNFLGGIAWGLGVTIGLSIILAVLSFIGSKVDFIPVIGEFVARINEFVASQDPKLLK